MFSPRCRGLGRRVRAWLVLLGVVSIAGLFAPIRSPDFTRTWLQPVRQVLAQSDPATPTLVPPPNPTVGLNEPPLTLQSSASAASAPAGERLSFTTTVATASEAARAVELRASIDGQLELLTVSGSCSGGSALSCKLSVQRGRPVTIVATVRVRPSAAVGSRLVYQALAQDDLSNTAASDQVVVTIAPPPIAPTRSPDPAPRPTIVLDIPANDTSAPARPKVPASRPARTAPTVLPASVANPITPDPPAPTTLALPIVPVAIMRSSVGAATVDVPAGGAAPADSWLVWAPGVPAPTQALDAVAPVVPAPELASDAPVATEQRQIVLLPNTAAAPSITGLVAVLLGLALTIHGLRRVRRAAAQLERQGAALGRLAALANVQARRRARMGDRSCEAREE